MSKTVAPFLRSLAKRLIPLRWGLASLSLVLLGGVLANTPGVVLTPEQISQAGTKYGETAVKRLNAWQELIKNSKDKDVMEKLNLVNDFFNGSIRYANDINHWGVKDYWATPVETLGTGKGDCEDYAIAKYLSLRELGLADENLRISYVKYRKKGTAYEEAHMVLSYYESLNKEPYILDNINKSLLKASARTDLIPVYSFNADGLWVAKGGGAGQKAGSSSRLKAWNSVREKMAGNGQLAAAD
ncbi:MAG: transglutaminase-like cysteine peptidase [Gammaproteobacteria bacterium]|nr:transglutaminase-like cysteine peptidase [Gammaproteobacteria bacterium]